MTIKYVGAHINKDKTILKTMENIRLAGGNALQIFASNPRSTNMTDLKKYEILSKEINEYLKKHDFKLVIHSPYVINVANDFKHDKRTMPIEKCYWIQSIINQLEISNIIGSDGVVLHVGKYVKLTNENGLENMKIAINYILSYMIENKLNTKLIIETPAGQGTELLTDLKDFTNFINNFTKQQQKYLGICFDTAHTWALGYSLVDVTLIHFNNSEVNKGDKKDRHAVLFNGKISNKEVDDFIKKLNKYNSIIILETPSVEYSVEIKHIYDLL
jgi:endonuclease IV